MLSCLLATAAVARKPPSDLVRPATHGRTVYAAGIMDELNKQNLIPRRHGDRGLIRLVNMPKQFNLDVRVPNNGGPTAPISHQCNKLQTTLLLVAKNWDKLGEGAGWLWVKSGKFAGR
jgi:hypothetical protein